jgi:hypothetical protein
MIPVYVDYAVKMGRTIETENKCKKSTKECGKKLSEHASLNDTSSWWTAYLVR